MSAFVVGHDHIDALLTFAIDREVTYWTGTDRVMATTFTADSIGQILLEENEVSVNHRYPHDSEDEMPGTIGQRAANYRYKRFMRPLSTVAVLKGCRCFDYQACEHDGWEASVAHSIIQAIQSYAISSLPGYDGAEGWEFRREAPQRRVA